jgi:hypothetical protein
LLCVAKIAHFSAQFSWNLIGISQNARELLKNIECFRVFRDWAEFKEKKCAQLRKLCFKNMGFRTQWREMGAGLYGASEVIAVGFEERSVCPSLFATF